MINPSSPQVINLYVAASDFTSISTLNSGSLCPDTVKGKISKNQNNILYTEFNFMDLKPYNEKAICKRKKNIPANKMPNYNEVIIKLLKKKKAASIN